MAATPLASVLQTLPSLPSKELEAIKQKVQALLSLRGGCDTTEEPDDSYDLAAPPFDYIFDGICYELRRRGLIKQNGFIPKTRWPKNFSKSSKEMREFLETQFSEPLSPAQLTLLGRLSAEALASYLEHVVPISPTTLMSNLDKIPTALEQMLPGYLRAGLLFMIFERSDRYDD